MTEIVVIDYGAGNLRSVSQAVEQSGGIPVVTNNPKIVSNAGKIILPGVGAFPAAMRQLATRGLDEAVRDAAQRGNLLLGLCLGMQLLFDSSDEFATTSGLGLIPGTVTRIPLLASDGRARRVPHIGWNELLRGSGGDGWRNSVMRDVPEESPVYFLHSFMANPTYSGHRIADSLIDDLRVTSFVQRENVSGCQFHPEKSGRTGLKIFEEFVRL